MVAQSVQWRSYRVRMVGGGGLLLSGGGTKQGAVSLLPVRSVLLVL